MPGAAGSQDSLIPGSYIPGATTAPALLNAVFTALRQTYGPWSVRGRATREAAEPVPYALAHTGSLNTQLSVSGGGALQVRVPLLAPLRRAAQLPLRWWCVHGSPFDLAISPGGTRCVSGALPMNSLQRYLCFSRPFWQGCSRRQI
jgi:hypothetical protein